jgi:hypothetical protein
VLPKLETGEGRGGCKAPWREEEIGKKRGAGGYCVPLRCNRPTSVAEDIVVG